MPDTRRAFLSASAPLVAGLAGCVSTISGQKRTTSDTDTTTATATTHGATWEPGPPLPDRRTEVSAAALDGDLYAVGGLTASGGTGGVLALDPAAGEWREVPSPPTNRHHVPVVALDGELYVVGGFRDGFTPQDAVDVYDPAAGEWRTGPRLPEPRGAAVLDGTLFVAGGVTPDGVVATTVALDAGAGEWREVAPMPTAREHLAAGAANDRLVAAGGRQGFGNELGATEAYDPSTDEWSEGAGMPTPRGGVGGAGLDGRVFVLGGESPEGTFDDAEAYDPAADEWARFPSMPTARHGLGVAAPDGRLYAVAGGPEPGATYSSVVEVFDPGDG